MTVLHVNEHLERKGGVETYMLSLLPMLTGRGIRARVAYASGDPAHFTSSVQLPDIGRTGFRGLKTSRLRMLELLKAERPDVVHVHNVQNVGVLQACQIYGRTVLTTHDYRLACPASTFFHRRTNETCTRTCGPSCFTTTLTKHCLSPRPQYASYYYYRVKWAIKNRHGFSHMIAPSGDTADRLVRAGYENNKITVLPYFCAMEPAKKPRPIPKRITITFIGRLAANKGVQEFIGALGLLPGSVRGIMVGNFDDAVEASTIALAREHGCADRLELRRWATKAEIVETLDQTTVFVFPSLWPETLGIVGLEALSRGVPVVASDIGGVREWLRHGENGFLVQPKSAEQISDAIDELIWDDAKLTAFGERGLATIRDRFVPEKHLENLLNVYERVAA